ncbi:aminotransferase class III-fold pyridoxal phosphate-dependent enzyme [Reyranella sp.]|uniref:aminotransferase class III-fold pyridoxal phosphate-dependent enzyme n=1 Tax=Reyranella sp. TaxID=1929291 RepID=UPI00351F7634
MNLMDGETVAALVAGGLALFLLAPRVRNRLMLSRAKHRSLAGHARMSRRIAGLVPHYVYEGDLFFRADDASEAVSARRRIGFDALAETLRSGDGRTLRLTSEATRHISDLQFTESYRVPFQFSPRVRAALPAGAFVASSEGVQVTDLDGTARYDLSGSYGVNLLGYDFYKGCMERGARRVAGLGPVLGAYPDLVADNARRLARISGKPEVSFHMSGTEAVMQAVRLARYHTGRSHLVRFCGAYNGWWGDVQPGVGNPVAAHDTYTLADLSEKTLAVLRRRTDIACVLVNPIQAMHPNQGAPADSTLIASRPDRGVSRETYAAWLKALRQVCTERGIVLILDEVFVGFRLAAGGAQEYFGIEADLVTYGKTVGGGFPIGVVCGDHRLMKRFRDDRPADICFARGTFNAHPYVMGAMNEFLLHLDSPEMKQVYCDLDQTWDRRASELNRRLAERQLPVRIGHLSSIWTVCYPTAARYHWMFQYYLKAHGLALSWVGTGRLIFSLNFTEEQFQAVADRFVAAAEAMQRDGWWEPGVLATDRAIKRRILREMASHLLGFPGRERKERLAGPQPLDAAL